MDRHIFFLSVQNSIKKVKNFNTGNPIFCNSLMFLFSWLDLGIDIADLEKSIVWSVSRFLGFSKFQLLKIVIVCTGGIFEIPLKSVKNENFVKFSEKLLSFPKNIFGASYDNVVA